MLGIVPPTRPGDTQPQCHGDRDLARVLGLLREERAGTLIRVETNPPETNSPPTKEATHAWSTHTLGSIR